LESKTSAYLNLKHKSIENQTGKLFGSLWGNLNDDQYKESVALFTKRAVANKFNLAWLKNKKCLDAGCGSGRYSVAMAIHGARQIIALDISKTGINEAKRRTSKFRQITFRKASVLQLPFRNKSFDFVWSAGVIHHTQDFDRALSELTRVLRKNGKLFLLVYGAGGLRWKAVKAIRNIFSDLSQDFLDKSIRFAKMSANNRKHFMDDLLVPIQKLTTFKEMQTKLHALGIKKIKRWTGDTFDHERNLETQLLDIKKIKKIASACCQIAHSSKDRILSQIIKEIVDLYVKWTVRIMRSPKLSIKEKRKIIIGEGNLRILAEK